jgi:hypothetical protein
LIDIESQQKILLRKIEAELKIRMSKKGGGGGTIKEQA